MTSAETAEGICAALARAEAAFDKRGWQEMPKADRKRYIERALLARPLITTAILEAENAKLEEALGTIGQGFWGTKENPHRHGSVEAIWIGMKPDEMIEAIRSLISKKEPVDLVGIGTAALERGLNSKPKD